MAGQDLHDRYFQSVYTDIIYLYQVDKQNQPSTCVQYILYIGAIN